MKNKRITRVLHLNNGISRNWYYLGNNLDVACKEGVYHFLGSTPNQIKVEVSNNPIRGFEPFKILRSSGFMWYYNTAASNYRSLTLRAGNILIKQFNPPKDVSNLYLKITKI